MREAAAEDVQLVPQASAGEAGFPLRFGQVVADPIAQLDPLQVLPNAFVRIQFCGIPRQAREVAKLNQLRAVGLPAELFADVSEKLVAAW